MDHPFLFSAESTCLELLVDSKVGLSTEEVNKRIKTHGANELTAEPKTPLYVLLMEQFQGEYYY
jgi:magnesium-transporting ATPase (P-type)